MKTLHRGENPGVALKAEITLEQKTIVSLIQKGTSVFQLKADFPHKQIFIYQNSIYDLSDYKHPGGSIFFNNHLWEEISRYMQGMHPDELTNTGLHTHSTDAYQVLDLNYIGSVLPNIGEEIEDTNPLVESSTDNVVQVDTDFEVGFKQDVSDNLVLMRVQNRLFNQRILLKGVKWMGKHYYLSH